ncbi:aminotransferase class I/II-fold pyridoxal phosphate-dependent enzyme [Aeromonas dhakensis]|uniref:pyridoxal phosphate-dependent aminotransferase n=1 Tax=Aeromonas dhakensis TaxID=196024 RepID=UPI00208DDDD5|nr:aminotransferase class I/II-fold pyridoxal phosphate-dependent enzyme [Aeromonas dhakensis]USP10228.1 aminotransferase class I/II-fold pyridoxal phosphate-dependent enzyme [Aeromonas dhakensis]
MLKISKRFQLVKKPASISISEQAKEMSAIYSDFIDVSIGQPDHRPPISIDDLIFSYEKDSSSKYGQVQGNAELRSLIADNTNSLHGTKYTKENVIITPGVKQALHYLFMTYLDSNDEVIIPKPCWLSYDSLVSLHGGVSVNIESSAKKKFICNISDIINAITEKTKMVLISNPVNPTGVFWNKEDIIPLCNILSEKKIPLVIDAIYEDIDFYQKKTLMSEFSENIKNIIYLSGFSKNIAIPGYRIGYVLAETSIISSLTTCQSQLITCPSVIDQHIVHSALKKIPSHYIKNTCSHYQSRANFFCGELDKIAIRYIRPDGAFYILVDVSWISNKSTISSEVILEQEHISTVPGSEYGISTEGYIRISLVRSIDDLKKIISSLFRMKASLKI